MIAEATETFWVLFKSLPHWEFEIFLMIVFDVVIGYFIWGAIKRHIHKDDKKLEDIIREEVDNRFEELVTHMHEDLVVLMNDDDKVDHSDYHAQQIAGRDDV